MAYPDASGPGDQSFQLRRQATSVASLNDGSETQTNLPVTKNGDVAIGMYTSRTPSPTPSEHALLKRKGVIDWKKLMSRRFWIRREWLWYYVLVGILLVIVILITVYDRQIVRWLQPTAEKIRKLPAGWLIPIGIFFVISFPPLFGHEILAILVGVVWGLGVGFAITAAGTFVGEMGNYYAFKYCCRARGEKLEKKDLQYACLARIVREGGFKVALVARYSAIPGHFTTAVFSTCGMGVLVFALAAALSLPKQFVTVYIGVILQESGTGTETKRDKIISETVLAVTIIITCLAMWYMYKKMDEVKEDVIYSRRKARGDHFANSVNFLSYFSQAKLDRAQSLRGSSIFNPAESESDLPLNPGEDNVYQQWNAHGQATGFSGDPRFSQTLHVPTPQRPGGASVSRVPTYYNEGGGYSSDERYGSPSASSHASPFSTPQAVSPIAPPAPHRQASTDSVGWDAAGTVGGEAYRLPTIQPHTPLSGGFVNTRLPTNNPFNRTTVHSTYQTAPSPVPPPLAPPQTSNQRSINPYSPPPSPFRHATTFTPTAQNFPAQTFTASASPYSAHITASPTLQQYPVTIHPAPQSPLHSPLPTPTQYTYTAAQPHPQVHAQTYGIPSQPQSPVGAPAHHTVVTGSPVPHSPGGATTSPALGPNIAGVGSASAHGKESSDASVYYTPPHSRYPTTENEPERLPTPDIPPPEYRP